MKRKKYWKEIMFKNETIAEISIDGRVFRFEADIIVPLLEDLPNDKGGWFFNDTRDRYCAEWADKEGYVIVNPDKVLGLFDTPIIW